MLNSISWNEFLTAILIAGGTYYIVSFLLFYSQEIKSVLKGEKKITLPKSFEKSADLIGSAKADEPRVVRETSVAADELIPSQTEDALSQERAINDNAETILLGTVSDFLQESKTLAQVIAENKAPREECVSLFQSLLERYPQIIGTPYQEGLHVSLFHTCKDTCGFEFSQNEIASWWPEVSRDTSNQ